MKNQLTPYETKLIKLMLATCVLASASFVRAAGTPLACQFDGIGGLKWDGGQWLQANYAIRGKFILVLDGTNITQDSAATAMGTLQPQCQSGGKDEIICTDQLAGFLVFNFKNLRGGMAKLLGATQRSSDKVKDSIYVEPFFCQRF